ncbi:hypothetical protein [Candidatus Nanohalococcus occultus]|uniref:t-SNARE coiled-coil homology domain-containing protein n=1 Tax=Candidatus Nanohalococcus occultus TaxID=2978047 RepID=A0ABY8CEW4_9ARCH|nr:hypothetical protein SVXNc_0237 [Candidatus Nanohaloarchaeota archaeon SVXNc]
MSWRETAEKTITELRTDGLEETVKDVERSYVIDQTELGKILLIASLSLMVASIPSAMTLQSAQDDINAVNQDLDEVQGVIGSDRFQSSMETLQTRIGGDLGRTLDRVTDGVETTNQSVQQLESTQSKLEENAEIYRWLSLVSIIGVISGIATIYI